MKLMRNSCIAVLATVAVSASPVLAGDFQPTPVSAWSWDIGARYWVSTGQIVYDLTNPGDASPISRLDYDGLDAQSGEFYFHGAHSSGLFIKGFFGGGKVRDGSLDDEDYCVPGLGGLPGAVCAGAPASATWSDTFSEADGRINFASVDVGYYFLNRQGSTYGGMKDESPVVHSGYRLGAFVGFHYWQEDLDAFGIRCNPVDTGISGSGCFGFAPGDVVLPFNTRVISEQDDFYSLRLGLVGDVQLTPKVNLSGEIAYVKTDQEALDIHYFTFGPAPANGDGSGFQAEVILNYQVTDSFGLGIGGRWWELETTAVETLFGGRLDYESERYGGFLQANFKLN